MLTELLVFCFLRCSFYTFVPVRVDSVHFSVVSHEVRVMSVGVFVEKGTGCVVIVLCLGESCSPRVRI